MLIPKKFRSCTEYREILRILQKATSLQENFLWQSHATRKNIINIHHFEIDFVSRGIVVFYDARQSMVDTELPLYVKLDYRSSVFKVSEFRLSQNSMHFSFPAELKTLELRSVPRHQFAIADEKHVTLRPSMNNLPMSSGSELQMRVIDASPQGLGLIVSEYNRSFLKNNRILWLNRVQDMELNHPVLAEVVYISNDVENKFLKRKQREMKVGLKLSTELSADTFQGFTQ